MFRVDDKVRVVAYSLPMGYMHSYAIGEFGKVSHIDPKDGGIKVVSEQWPYEQWLHESEIVHG